jgi:hypothetical protein
MRQAGMGRGNITRELEKLTSAGLVRVTQSGNQSIWLIHYPRTVSANLSLQLMSISYKIRTGQEVK